ncbi:hypothetical protein [Candidatus Nitrotoga sp. 1052]|uniref:hypothetical protein n=1 Tax=Candidatus Nitrotoga sp. 1052 TaxID=2886964 RepID=UPI001EF658F2|nr:hypothetical protein [Candidatus Nitrotoga sp. 1052]
MKGAILFQFQFDSGTRRERANNVENIVCLRKINNDWLSDARVEIQPFKNESASIHWIPACPNLSLTSAHRKAGITTIFEVL